MKKVREGKIRRKEILSAARELFINKGYDQTSVDDILKIVDIAKGTFYYYFSSKAEVLEVIILNIVDEGVIRAETILKDKSIPPTNRIMLAIMAQAPNFEGSDELKLAIHNVENTKLERLYLKEMLARMTPILQEPINEGMEQGMFHMIYPIETIESLLLLGHMMFDCDVFQWAKEDYARKIKAFLFNAEKLLGAKEGDLSVFLQMFM